MRLERFVRKGAGSRAYLPCEPVFGDSARLPYARFARALPAGNATLVRAAAAELPHVALEDALRVWVVLALESGVATSRRGALAWSPATGRARGVTLADAQRAAAALTALPQRGKEAATLAAFAAFCEVRGLARAAHGLEELGL